MYKIRQFGRETLCSSLDALERELRSQYCGQSVSVQWVSHLTGMARIKMVDVLRDGMIIPSQGGAQLSLAEILHEPTQTKSVTNADRNALQELSDTATNQQTLPLLLNHVLGRDK